MNILTILKFPDPILRKKSEHVNNITKEIKNIIISMSETMYYNDGLGLAAIQTGIKKNILLINLSNKKKYILTIINPKVISKNGNTESKEGCLSFPKIFLNVKRKKNITVKFLATDNIYKKIKIDNMICICLQHEIDHLNGITLYDKVSNFKKNLILKKIT